MSSFNYGKHTEKHIGIWLRLNTNPGVIDLINSSKQKRFFDTVDRVIVSDYDGETGQVWLQVWCKSLLDTVRGKARHNVFHIKTAVNEEWSCDGDLGSGANF